MRDRDTGPEKTEAALTVRWPPNMPMALIWTNRCVELLAYPQDWFVCVEHVIAQDEQAGMQGNQFEHGFMISFDRVMAFFRNRGGDRDPDLYRTIHRSPT